MKLGYPITGIANKEFANLFGFRPIKVNRLSPFILISVCKIILTIFFIFFEIITAGSKVIINNVEYSPKPMGVRSVNKSP